MTKTSKWLESAPAPLHQWLKDRKIDQVSCIFADVAGGTRGKTVAAKKFDPQDDTFMADSVFYQTITGNYTERSGEDGWTEPDMVLKPDLTTTVACPWTNDVTVQIIHDVCNLDGEPVGLAPRNVLKRVLSYYEREGWQPVVAPELEFYLTEPHTDSGLPIKPSAGRTNRKTVRRQVYSLSVLDEYGPVTEDIQSFAKAQGFDIDAIVQEDGSGQIEINLKHGNAVSLADQVFCFRRTIHEAALRHDCFATFMAKPMQGEPGSAMHIHQSIVDTKTGKNIFSTQDGQPSDLFYGFIAGQQQHLPSVFCLIAPYVNSYRRFVAGLSAPINLEWGEDNRTTGLRIPLSPPQARRVENRIIGMDCNPYLALAACLASGFIGMKMASSPRDAMVGEAYKSELTMPRSLDMALELFAGKTEITDMLGNDFCQLYRSIKKSEADEFSAIITPWERDHLLLNV